MEAQGLASNTMSPARTAPVSLEAEISALESAPVAVLRKQWSSLFDHAPPSAFGPDLLRRRIAQHLQERAYGGLSRPMQRILDRLVHAHRVKPSGNIAVPRQVQSGTTLSRTWKGMSHVVTVLDDGFAWDSKVWPSLSEVAREITGTRWNGPRFFGLRAEKRPVAATDPAPTAPPVSKRPNRKARASHGL